MDKNNKKMNCFTIGHSTYESETFVKLLKLNSIEWLVDVRSVTECIKKKAYDFWVEKCRKQGRDVNYWLDAEKISDDVAVKKFDGAHSD